MPSFKGTITFEFDSDDSKDTFLQSFNEGKEGSAPSDWPRKYDLGDYPFDRFKVTSVKVRGKTVELSLDVEVENATHLEQDRFVASVKEGFQLLEDLGPSDREWVITQSKAVTLQGGRKRRRYTRRRKSRKTRKTERP